MMYHTELQGHGAIQTPKTQELTDIKSVTTYSDYFELDLHSFGTKFTNTGIYQAIKDRNLLQLQRCIKYGENVSLLDEEFGTSYLLLVIDSAELHNERDYLPMIHELSMAGIDPNKADFKGNTPLSDSIRKNLEDIMVSLLQVGAEGSEKMAELIRKYSGPFQMQTWKWYQRHTPSLKYAIENEDIRKVKRLISCWCRINVKYNGISLHELACKLHGRQHIICDLLESHFHTLEFIHAALAGNSARVLEFKENHHCDHNWLNKGYQKNILSPLQPRSIYEYVKDLGHKHLLNIVPKSTVTGQTERQVEKSPAENNISRLCLIS